MVSYDYITNSSAEAPQILTFIRRGLRFFVFQVKRGRMTMMAKRVVLADFQRRIAAKLAEYIREEEAGWEITAFTQVSVLRRELQDSRKN